MFQSSQNIRIKRVLIIGILLFFLVLLRVFWIQVINYNKLNKLANNLWSRNLPVQADRGLILDRNGKVIADNVTTAGLILIPSQITEIENVCEVLSEKLNVTYEEIYKHATKKTSIERVHPEGRGIDYKIADEIESYNFDGVYLVKESTRYYPYKELLSHVIGYVGIDNQGLSGLELMYDKYLTGTDGTIKYYSDGHGNKLNMAQIYESGTNGDNLYLTIDLDVQLALERELNNAETKYNASGAIGIVMKVKTGEILAMSSRPNFDPENYQNYSEEVINRNLAIWSNFEPGSTFKITTLAAAIEEKKVNIFEDTYYDTGHITVAGTKLHCWKLKGHGFQTYIQVVENSCNPGFVALGQKLGKETLFRYINEFGFGKKTGIDLNGESSGIIFDLDKVGPLELATTAFGQGVSVTALQQVQAVSAIVNNGIMLQAYIVSKIQTADDVSVLEVNSKIKKENIISTETSSHVRYALESVVANGSGRNSYIEGYRVAGKTGTAQKVGSDGKYMVGNYVLSFIGFMPANDPEYIIYIAVDNAKGVVQYGGTVAAPIAQNVFKEIINIYNIKPSSDGLPKTYRWNDNVYITVPDVINKSVKEAKKILKGFTIEYSGTGDKVIDISPSQGSRIKQNSTVKLLLN